MTICEPYLPATSVAVSPNS